MKLNRDCHWREFRLAVASHPSEPSKQYGVSTGGPIEAGCMMYDTCQKMGMTDATHIHGVADGAPWIVDQYEDQFGANHAFYIDYYHVTEYLSEVKKDIFGDKENEDKWYNEQKKLLLSGRSESVIENLSELKKNHPSSEAVTSAHRYLENRELYLNHKNTIDADMPIVSGEVESGHSILQDRLKKKEAWWVFENAESMAYLKVVQANGDWDEMWKKIAA